MCLSSLNSDCISSQPCQKFSFLNFHFSIFLALPALAIALTSCSADEELNNVYENQVESVETIGFSVQTSTPTRATNAYCGNMHPGHFNVYALDGNNRYFATGTENVSSFDDGNTWIADHNLCWPTGKSANWSGLDFYAYIDDSSSANNGVFDISDGCAKFKDFTVASDARSQSDLMYAVAKGVTQSSFHGDVPLTFRHSLSEICFMAQNNDPRLSDIEIIAIEVGGLAGRGTYRFPDGTTKNGYQAVKGEWTLDEESAGSVFTLSDMNVHLGDTDGNENGKLINISMPEYTGDNDAHVANTMYLLPQSVAPRESADSAVGAYLKVTAKLTLKESGENVVEEKFIPMTADWEENQCYIYKIEWKAIPIHFSANVADYSDVVLSRI